MIDNDRLIDLLARTANGDQQAFRSLYTDTSAHLNAVLLRMLRRRDWADEALQDCYLRVWQKADTYAAEKGAPMTWLMSIARYRGLDLLRARRPEISDDLAPEESAPEFQAPERLAESDQAMGQLEHCLEGLGTEQRKSILMAFYEGYTHSELSERLETPVGTVKSWVRRGLLRLRECLDAAVKS